MALCNGRINLYRYKPERSIYVSYSRPLLFPFTLYCLFFNFNITIFTLTHACDFAWKIVPLWYQQQLQSPSPFKSLCCDLLEKSYLCGINNNFCLKVNENLALWFAWKIVPLWYQQQPTLSHRRFGLRCDLLEKSYLCGINNNHVFIIISP